MASWATRRVVMLSATTMLAVLRARSVSLDELYVSCMRSDPVFYKIKSGVFYFPRNVLQSVKLVLVVVMRS